MKRKIIALFCLLFILIILVAANMSIGSLGSSDVDAATLNTIIYSIRMPRILAAVVLGGALSVSGFLLQTFFGNPIAGPYVLGISSGAKLVVALTMVASISAGIHPNNMMMVGSAFVGALIAMGFVLALSSRVRNMSRLVVCGILIGYICSAITDFVVTFADDSSIVNLHNWSMGTFSGTDWEDVIIMSVFVLIAVLIAFLMAKPIGAFQLGEAYARNMGVNVFALRIILILLSSILSATVTAFAGPISFVGIAVPHLMKLCIKTAKPIYMIPVCFMGGAVITLFCDGIARTLFAPTELSVSTVTAIFLVPVVIVMMVRKQEGR